MIDLNSVGDTSEIRSTTEIKGYEIRRNEFLVNWCALTESSYLEVLSPRVSKLIEIDHFFFPMN